MIFTASADYPELRVASRKASERAWLKIPAKLPTLARVDSIIDMFWRS